MQITQDILLPVLLAAIVANTVILVLLVVLTRFGRSDRMTTTRSIMEGSMLSTSFVDRSARSSWQAGGAPETNGPRDEGTDAADAAAPQYDDEDEDEDEEGGSVISDIAAARDRAAQSEPDPVALGDEPETPAPATGGVDALTGLLDHPSFTRLVAAEDLRVQRYHRPATIVIFELDGLDRLIDRLGPEAADRVVPALADTMRRLARVTDQLARLAPSRFGVLLPETDEVAAINYVERVRRACELWLESGAIALSLAAGWAGTAGDPTLLEALRLATDRMYIELRREARKAER
jgi:diguanylate cyclase (GGDEF)-like protein